MQAPDFDRPLPPRGLAGIACTGLEAVAGALLVVTGVLIFGSTVLRYFGAGDPRAFEILRVVFVYFVGVAGVAAYARKENIVVPGVWRQDSIAYQLVCVLVSGAVVWLAAKYLAFMGWERDSTSLMGWPEATTYVPVLIFASGVLLISLARLVGLLRTERGPA